MPNSMYPMWCVREVGLAQADAAVDEQGVIGGVGFFGDLRRCRAREFVSLAGDEAVKGKGGVQPG